MRNSTRFLAVVVAAAGLLNVAGPVVAGPIVYVTTSAGGGSSHLGRVDLATGRYTDIGLTRDGTTDLIFTGITFIGQTLYGIANPAGAGSGLYTINKATGASTRVGPTSIGGDFGLAADSSGKLFSAVDSAAGRPFLITLDATTGAATRVGDTLGLRSTTLLPGALAFGPPDQLYLNTNFDNRSDRFYSVDEANGGATLIKNQDSLDLSTAFVFAGNQMYLLIDGRSIGTIDLTNGSVTDLNRRITGLPDGVTRVLTAAALVPEPSSLALLAAASATAGLFWCVGSRTIPLWR